MAGHPEEAAAAAAGAAEEARARFLTPRRHREAALTKFAQLLRMLRIVVISAVAFNHRRIAPRLRHARAGAVDHK